jgi:hypothetical protein
VGAAAELDGQVGPGADVKSEVKWGDEA